MSVFVTRNTLKQILRGYPTVTFSKLIRIKKSVNVKPSLPVELIVKSSNQTINQPDSVCTHASPIKPTVKAKVKIANQPKLELNNTTTTYVRWSIEH